VRDGLLLRLELGLRRRRFLIMPLLLDVRVDPQPRDEDRQKTRGDHQRDRLLLGGDGRAVRHLQAEPLLLELGLRLDAGAPLGLLQPELVLALLSLLFLDAPALRVLRLAAAPLRLVANPLLFRQLLLPRLFLALLEVFFFLPDALVFDLAQLAQGGKRRVFPFFRHGVLCFWPPYSLQKRPPSSNGVR